MNSFALIVFIVMIVFGLFFLLESALLVYGIWLLNKTVKKADRIDALEQDLNNIRREFRSLKGNPPPTP